MDREKWTQLFTINSTLTQLFDGIQKDVILLEKLSGLSQNEALDALEHFARAMSKTTDILNEKLNEDRAEDARVQEVEDVLKQVKKKIRFKEMFRDDSRKNNKKASNEGQEGIR